MYNQMKNMLIFLLNNIQLDMRQYPEKSKELVEIITAINEEDESEMTIWLKQLLEYAAGRKEWDTGGVWVCEAHPLMPFEQGLSFDCKCGAPGMPPSCRRK